MIEKRLAEIRESRGLNKKEVAEKIGIKPDTYRNYETGRLEPNLTVLVKLADFYGVTTDYLLGRGEPNDTMKKLAAEYNLNETEQILISDYINLDKYHKQAIIDFVQLTAERLNSLNRADSPEYIAAAAMSYDHPYAGSKPVDGRPHILKNDEELKSRIGNAVPPIIFNDNK